MCWVPAARPAPHRPSTWQGRPGWHVAHWCQAKGSVCPGQLQNNTSWHPLHWPPRHGKAWGGVIYYRPQTAPETTCQETGRENGARTTGDPGSNLTVAGGADVRAVSKREGLRGLSPVSPNTLQAEGWD